jgi:hypothetical protein
MMMMTTDTANCQRPAILLGALFIMEGETACAASIPFHANPYPSGTEEYDLWHEGWEVAQSTGFGRR